VMPAQPMEQRPAAITLRRDIRSVANSGVMIALL